MERVNDRARAGGVRTVVGVAGDVEVGLEAHGLLLLRRALLRARRALLLLQPPLAQRRRVQRLRKQPELTCNNTAPSV